MVAIDEDRNVRLTTNVIGVEPEAGAPRHAGGGRFRTARDVWLPLFVPTGEPDGDWSVPGPSTAASSAVAGEGRRFEHDCAITGIGMSEVGRRLMRPPLALTVEASLAALDDAGLTFDDIDGLCHLPGRFGSPGMGEGGTSALIEALRLKPVWHNGGRRDPGPDRSADRGDARRVVGPLPARPVFSHGVGGDLLAAAARREDPAGRRWPGVGMMEGRAPFGAMSAANWIAMAASQHFGRYGTTREQLGAIALNARANAARNPVAIYRDPMTMDDYLGPGWISTPFGLYDCDVPCDGCGGDRGLGSGRGAPTASSRRCSSMRSGPPIGDRLSWDQGTLTHEPQVFGPSPAPLASDPS